MKKPIIFIILLFAISVPVSACLWDRDTFAMEKKAFPGIYELITGNFAKHSMDYYQWRVKEIQPKIDDGTTDLSLYDDLAVAYSKLGDDQKAIDLMLKKNKLKPNQYETFANLGTFYIHDGQLENGLTYINKAIEINPNAHFGREIYQKYLVEFLLKKGSENGNFYNFLFDKYQQTHPRFNEYKLPEEELKKAIKGVAGMIHFGNSDSPILLNALGDLLLVNQDEEEISHKRLAALAYMRADLEEFGEIQESTKSKIESFLEIQEQDLNRFENLRSLLNQELKKSETMAAFIQKDEKQWIAEDKNVDEEYADKYYNPSIFKHPLAYVVYALIGLLIIFLGFKYFRNRKK